jgi:hypothetical protein
MAGLPLAEMVAICDADAHVLNSASEKRFPWAKRYTDIRKMLDEMGDRIDAVTVSTPDHNHAAAALMAMRMGKHCFCQWTRSPGHFAEWVRAIRGGEPAMSNFPNYSGRLTETILLGNLAVWVAAAGKGERVEWDAENLNSPNVAGLETVIKPPYCPGYTLDA